VVKIAKRDDAVEKAKKQIEHAKKKFLLISKRDAVIASTKRKVVKQIHALNLTPRDHRMLKIVGMKESTAKEMGGYVLEGMHALHASKTLIKYCDEAMSGGSIVTAVKYTYKGLETLVRMDNYYHAAKDSLHKHKYHSHWKSKSNERACACCHVVFKSVTLRKTLAKHNCRVCGEVVCHACSEYLAPC
jgi:FYVE zinc finger